MAWMIHGAPFEVPPLHPILVNFTAALVPVSFACDLVGRLSRRAGLTATGFWTMAIAAGITPLTVAAGWWWYFQMGAGEDWRMEIHQWLGTALAAVFLLWAWWRWRAHRRMLAPAPAYLLATGVMVLALIVQGDLGGQMSYGSESATTQRSITAPVIVPPGVQWRDHIDIPENAHGH